MSVNTKNDVISIWVKEYSSLLLTYAMKKLSNQHLAEDLVQETFITSFEKFETFDSNKNPEPWLKTILHNKIIDYYRKNSKSIIENIENNSEVAKNLRENFDENGHWVIDNIKGLVNLFSFENEEAQFYFLNHCIENLPSVWKSILMAKYFTQQEPIQICEEFSITKANYWQIIHRSKNALRTCISDKLNTEE